jgi:hypothetical protein
VTLSAAVPSLLLNPEIPMMYRGTSASPSADLLDLGYQIYSITLFVFYSLHLYVLRNIGNIKNKALFYIERSLTLTRSLASSNFTQFLLVDMLENNSKKRKAEEISLEPDNWWEMVLAKDRPLALKIVQECDWNWVESTDAFPSEWVQQYQCLFYARLSLVSIFLVSYGGNGSAVARALIKAGVVL